MFVPFGRNTEPRAHIKLLSQHIKDLSFENPHGPEFLASSKQRTKFSFAANVIVGTQSDNTQEVLLRVEAHADDDVGRVCHLDLSYGGLFSVNDLPRDLQRGVLFSTCPKMLFTDLRRVLADVTGLAGFPPLMLDSGRPYECTRNAPSLG
jgi:preprotein translocase subunit SecB